MAVNNEIEAYNFSQGVICHLYREIAAQRPALITKVGKYTFVDPLLQGGKLNEVTKEDLVEHIKIHDVDYLMYKTFPVNIAVIRGTYADESGNISFDQEPARRQSHLSGQRHRGKRQPERKAGLDPRGIH